MGAAEVDLTLFNALRALKSKPTSSAQPLAAVMRITAPLTPQNMDTWSALDLPAALLFFDRSRDDVDIETIGGAFEQRQRSRWNVYLVISDPQNEDAIIQGLTGVPGALAIRSTILR